MPSMNKKHKSECTENTPISLMVLVTDLKALRRSGDEAGKQKQSTYKTLLASSSSEINSVNDKKQKLNWNFGWFKNKAAFWLSPRWDDPVLYWELHLRRRCRCCDMLPRQRGTSACDKCFRLRLHFRPRFLGVVIGKENAWITGGRDDSGATALVRSDDAAEYLEKQSLVFALRGTKRRRGFKASSHPSLFSSGAADGSLAWKMKTWGFSAAWNKKLFSCTLTYVQVWSSANQCSTCIGPAILLSLKYLTRSTLACWPQQTTQQSAKKIFFLMICAQLLCIHVFHCFFCSSTFEIVSTHRLQTLSTTSSSIRKLLQMPRKMRRNSFCVTTFRLLE